jgi:hypothetical protein
VQSELLKLAQARWRNFFHLYTITVFDQLYRVQAGEQMRKMVSKQSEIWHIYPDVSINAYNCGQ